MTLGSLIARLEQERDAARAIEALGSLPLYAEVAAMAEHFSETPGEYVAIGASRFANEADEEDWLGLISAASQADDPGLVALSRLVRWALARDRQELQGIASQTCRCGGMPDGR